MCDGLLYPQIASAVVEQSALPDIHRVMEDAMPSVPCWQPDQDAKHCTNCRRSFKLTTRRHHVSVPATSSPPTPCFLHLNNQRLISLSLPVHRFCIS